MTLRFAPPAANWLLKTLCPGADYDAVIGDLTEQYQFGYSQWWYWKQVLVIIFLGNYRNAVQRPLVSSSRLPVGRMFAGLVVAVAVVGVLLSDIWWLLFFPMIGGAIVAVVVLGLRNRDNVEPGPMPKIAVLPIPTTFVPSMSLRKEIPMKAHRGINTASIAGEGFEGLPGLIMAIAFVFLFLSIFIPKDANWMLGVFIAVEVGASVLYIRSARRDREAAERAWHAIHEINEDTDRKR